MPSKLSNLFLGLGCLSPGYYLGIGYIPISNFISFLAMARFYLS